MSASASVIPSQPVCECGDLPLSDLTSLARRYGIKVSLVPDREPIDGSYWGDSEAGLRDNKLFVRSDTPVHSALHELGHYVCMAPDRRNALDTNAGGDYDEENAVCYLQIILADFLPAMSRSRMMQDMDVWGYTFRLGSAKQWFEHDASDARRWLLAHHIIDVSVNPTWAVRSLVSSD